MNQSNADTLLETIEIHIKSNTDKPITSLPILFYHH